MSKQNRWFAIALDLPPNLQTDEALVIAMREDEGSVVLKLLEERLATARTALETFIAEHPRLEALDRRYRRWIDDYLYEAGIPLGPEDDPELAWYVEQRTKLSHRTTLIQRIHRRVLELVASL